ncbi:MAG: thiamine phosphate synthase [Planctomycetota bacterium]
MEPDDNSGATRAARQQQLAHARLMWILSPPEDVGDAGTPPARAWLEKVAPALPEVDAVQVRPKARPASPTRPRAAPSFAVTEARASLEWTRAVLAAVAGLDPTRRPLVLVNDRIDVARALQAEGVDGAHVGDGDVPPRVARDVLGPDALLGLSTHGARDLVRALDEPIDMVGFGPVFATGTKGYDGSRGPALVGPDGAWIAQESSPLPVFPIGGIDLANVDELERAGRAAVATAISAAPDPARAARALREALVPVR